MKLQTILVAWAFGSLLGTLLAVIKRSTAYERKERRERFKKMLLVTMIAGIGAIVVMLLYTSISHGVNNSVGELNQIMTELQNQSPK